MAATTIHNTFEFDGEFKTRLDFSKLAGEKVSALMALEVLLLDEVTCRTAHGGVHSGINLLCRNNHYHVSSCVLKHIIT